MYDCEKKFVRIINSVDIYGNSFIPKHVRYELLGIHDNYVDIGINGVVMHKMKFNDIENYE